MNINVADMIFKYRHMLALSRKETTFIEPLQLSKRPHGPKYWQNLLSANSTAKRQEVLSWGIDKEIMNYRRR